MLKGDAEFLKHMSELADMGFRHSPAYGFAYK